MPPGAVGAGEEPLEDLAGALKELWHAVSEAKVDGFRSQVGRGVDVSGRWQAWQAQSEMKALREQHQHTLVVGA